MLNLKNINTFKKMSKNVLPVSRRNMQPNTITRREYKGKIYVNNIWKNSWLYRIRIQVKSQIGSGSGSEKIFPDPQHCSTVLLVEESFLYWYKGRIYQNYVLTIFYWRRAQFSFDCLLSFVSFCLFSSACSSWKAVFCEWRLNYVYSILLQRLCLLEDKRRLAGASCA